MRSIMHDKKEGTCYLCKLLRGDASRKITQEHHVMFGTANRRLSERYGLKVYLCIFHHTEGREAVHKSAELALLLKKKAQLAFEGKFPEISFRSIFGRNYLDDTDRQQASEKEEMPGFWIIEGGIKDLDW